MTGRPFTEQIISAFFCAVTTHFYNITVLLITTNLYMYARSHFLMQEYRMYPITIKLKHYRSLNCRATSSGGYGCQEVRVSCWHKSLHRAKLLSEWNPGYVYFTHWMYMSWVYTAVFIYSLVNIRVYWMNECTRHFLCSIFAIQVVCVFLHDYIVNDMKKIHCIFLIFELQFYEKSVIFQAYYKITCTILYRLIY